jgi:hypothetical protein
LEGVVPKKPKKAYKGKSASNRGYDPPGQGYGRGGNPNKGIRRFANEDFLSSLKAPFALSQEEFGGGPGWFEVDPATGMSPAQRATYYQNGLETRKNFANKGGVIGGAGLDLDDPGAYLNDAGGIQMDMKPKNWKNWKNVNQNPAQMGLAEWYKPGLQTPEPAQTPTYQGHSTEPTSREIAQPDRQPFDWRSMAERMQSGFKRPGLGNVGDFQPPVLGVGQRDDNAGDNIGLPRDPARPNLPRDPMREPRGNAFGWRRNQMYGKGRQRRGHPVQPRGGNRYLGGA